MKILIFSDNHGDKNTIVSIIKKHKDVDRIISLGDSELPKEFFESFNIKGVRGNYPLDPSFPLEMILEVNGYKLLFTHGHKFFVKFNLDRLYYRAKELMCDTVFYGHTHIPTDEIVDGIRFINPGAIKRPKMGSKRSYIILTIEDSIICDFHTV